MTGLALNSNMLFLIRKLIQGLVLTQGAVLGLLLGLYCSSVIALTNVDFINTGNVVSDSFQYETNTSNNTSSVEVMPKGMSVEITADSGALSSPTQAGDQISYTIELANLGLLGLSNVEISDTIIDAENLHLLSGDEDADSILDPSETWIYIGTYIITQADLDSNGDGDGDIDNLVSVSSNEIETQSASAEVHIEQAPSFVVNKEVGEASLDTPSTLTYTIDIINTGNLTLTGLSIIDTLPDGSLAELEGPAIDMGIPDAVDVSETWRYTTSYEVSQNDFDSVPSVENNVIVSASETGIVSQSSSAETLLNQVSDLTISQLVDRSEISSPSLLNYEVIVSNTGSVTLTNINITNILPDGVNGVLVGPEFDSGIVDAIDVGESWIYRLTYPVAQSYIDSGVALVNTVKVNSLETGNVDFESTVSTDIIREPQFTVENTVNKNSITVPENLSYVIKIANTGNVSLTDIETQNILAGIEKDLTGPVTDTGLVAVLDVGEVWEYTTSHSIVQADIDAGTDILNRVSVTTNETESLVLSADAITGINSAPDLAIETTVQQATVSEPGILNYQIRVTNIGNKTLNNPVVLNTLPDGSMGTLVGPTNDIGLLGAIDVDEVWEYSTSYSVTQNEIDSGVIRTNITSASSDETGSTLFTDSAVTTISRTPLFSVEKTVDATTVSTPGTLTYTITVKNTGNISLTNVLVEDILPDGSLAVLDIPSGDLAVADVVDVGESWTWLSTYEVNQGHINSGDVLVNQVTVTTAEAGSASDSAHTVVQQDASLLMRKSVNQTQYSAAGDTLDYTIVINNQGNVELFNINVLDDGLDDGTMSCMPSTYERLLPGMQIECVGSYTVTEADIENTQINNQASVIAYDSEGAELRIDSEIVSVSMQRVPPVAIDDTIISSLSAQPTILEGASNDTDVNDDILVNTVSLVHPDAVDSDQDNDFDSLMVVGEGSWIVDNITGTVLFTPIAAFTGDPTAVHYTVMDATGLVSNEALLSIDYPQSNPVAQNDLVVNTSTQSPTNPTTFNVLSDNGNGVDADSENDIDITSISLIHQDAVDTDGDGDNDSLSVSGEGVWIVDDSSGDVTFTPIAGFLEDPTPVLYTVKDLTGLVSNVAKMTIDYPQTAPSAVNDQVDDVFIGDVVLLSILANDVDPELNIDSSSVRILDASNGDMVTTVVVPREGRWQVDEINGEITFLPDRGFTASPKPVEYSVYDTTGLESNLATITVNYEPAASLEGVVWLDVDRDGDVDDNEERKAFWTLHILEDLGNIVPRTLSAHSLDDFGEFVTSTVTDEEGKFSVTGLKPGTYRVEFYNEQGVFMDSMQSIGPLRSGEMVNVALPIEPNGVVYDSISRKPVAGVTLNIANSSGLLLDESCLAPFQQGQVTTKDGLYSFTLSPGSHSTCPLNEVYSIRLSSVPTDYHQAFSKVIQPEGALECKEESGTCSNPEVFDSDWVERNCTVDVLPDTDACEIQNKPSPPLSSSDTRYFVDFRFTAGDRNVVFNHIPIDAKANDAEILLSKLVDRREVSIGSLVKYIITAENLKEIPAFSVDIVDSPPAGFVLVPDSVHLIRTGEDEEFGTEDDIVMSHGSHGADPINFELVDFDALETVRLSYVMRIGTGVVQGIHNNFAHAIGPNGTASNKVSADVLVVPDPVLQQATLVGKVFEDHDSDGAQDIAEVTGLKIESEYYGDSGLVLGELPARRSISDDPHASKIIVNMPLTDNNNFHLSSKEGTRIWIDEHGNVTESHVGLRARGLSSQDIRVCTRQTIAVPTIRNNDETAEATEVLEIEITNYGVKERGIPGVRLATVTGLVIETDGFGRFNIPDVASGNTGIGQNYILKIDVSSLPQGSVLTTENPNVLRILNHSLNRINFGVRLRNNLSDDPYSPAYDKCGERKNSEVSSERVVVNLGSVFFDSGQFTIRPDYVGIVQDILSKLREFGSGDIVIEAHTDSQGSAEDNIKLAERRAAEIKSLISRYLGADLLNNISVEIAPSAYVEQLR